jgi:twitching motility protein PilT
MQLGNLIKELAEREGSDIHLVVGSRPTLRFSGDLKRFESEEDIVGKDDVWKMFEPLLTEAQKLAIENRQDVHRSIAWADDNVKARLRVCLFWDRKGLSASLRLIPTKIPLLSELFRDDRESLFRQLTHLNRGLVLVVGMTGSGKSTTVAAMINEINISRRERIFTIEDPLEYVHTSKMSLISQREVGTDVNSHEEGALSVMRADPDVVLIGEFQTPESVRIALTLADIGHLVFSTMQAESVSEVVRRLIESFPDAKETTQLLLANNIQAVVTQSLVPKIGGGRDPINDIVIATPIIRQMIKSGQTDITLAIEAGGSNCMRTMDDCLLSLYQDGSISYDTALSRLKDRGRLGQRPVATESEKGELACY